MSTRISIKNVRKEYENNFVAIQDASLDIKESEFFTLLGPSGCGKTTLLRMIAGFNSIESGTIGFNDKVINDIPPHKRNIGMVFQNYAIFPHMTVQENVEYGLKLKKLTKEQIPNLARDIMDKVKILEQAPKLPDKLSGGQQQRVALARAVVIRPDVLLMDEPLSNLDAKLRVEMRTAIKRIQKDEGITTVYVTHDQEEALAVSDRIAIMNQGNIHQIGSPKEIYLRPNDLFVAGFIGTSNFFDCKLSTADGESKVEFEGGYRANVPGISGNYSGEAVKVSVRPEEFKISESGSGIHGIVDLSTFLGHYTNYVIKLDNGQEVEVTISTTDATRFYDSGDHVHLEVLPHRINVFNAEGTQNLIEGGAGL